MVNSFPTPFLPKSLHVGMTVSLLIIVHFLFSTVQEVGW